MISPSLMTLNAVQALKGKRLRTQAHFLSICENAKKENQPGDYPQGSQPYNKGHSLSGSTISISDLLDCVNKHFPVGVLDGPGLCSWEKQKTPLTAQSLELPFKTE